ncbi:MAG: hypothetical protein QRY72_03100 [Candidatus Rhabdochlamydia sp.]
MKILSLSKHFARHKQVTDSVLDKAGLKVSGPGDLGEQYASKCERQG